MSDMELKVGRVYRAKKPRPVYTGVTAYYNDRQVLWIGLGEVQYDSPSIGFGKKYGKATTEAFLKWAGSDVTDEMPKEDWAKIEPKQHQRAS